MSDQFKGKESNKKYNYLFLIGITIYLVLFLMGILSSLFYVFSEQFPFLMRLFFSQLFLQEILKFKLVLICVLMGGFGGAMSCLRAVYIHYCAERDWDNQWYPWYVIRPLVSMLSGGVSFLFLKAGLMILEGNAQAESTPSFYVFCVLAFIAGLNVDSFIAKIEDVAQKFFGITKKQRNQINNNHLNSEK